MVPWKSFPLEVTYQVFGWLAFLSWAVAGYPQIILNFRRKRWFFSCSIIIAVVVFPLGWILKWFCIQTQCGGIKLGFCAS